MSRNYPSKKKIEITDHAKRRIQERAPHIDIKQCRQWVYSARYKGNALTDVDESIQRWVDSRLRNDRTQLRVFDDYIFVFKGNCKHIRTLVTIYPIPDKIKSKSSVCDNKNRTLDVQKDPVR